jgi:hypothetical protein
MEFDEYKTYSYWRRQRKINKITEKIMLGFVFFTIITSIALL